MKSYTVEPKIWRSGSLTFGDPDDRQESRVLLGRLAEAGPKTDVSFDLTGERVVAIFGKRGSGKSYTLGVLLEGMCASDPSSVGQMATPRATLLLDTLNVFWSLLYPFKDQETLPERVAGAAIARRYGLSPETTCVQVFVPQGSPVPMADFRTFSIGYSQLDAEDWAALLDLDPYTDRPGQLLNEVWLKVVEDGWRSELGEMAPSRDYAVNDLLDCIAQDVEIQEVYAPETRRALRQRLSAVRANPVFGDVGTPLSELLRPGYVTVLELNLMSDPLRRVTTGLLIRKILNSRAEAADIAKQLRFNPNLTEDERRSIEARLAALPPKTTLAIDEAQNVLPSERQVSSTSALVKFVREGRNHGLSMFLTSQQPAAIDSRIMAQVDTLIAHKLTVKGDAEAVLRNLKTTEPESVKYMNRNLDTLDLLRTLDMGQALVSNSESLRGFLATVRPRITPHGGVES